MLRKLSPLHKIFVAFGFELCDGLVIGASPWRETTMANLLTTYTNRATGRTTVMHAGNLCGYVERVADENRTRGFYYAVLVAKDGDVVPSYCMSDAFKDNVAHVHNEWAGAR